MYIVNSRFVFYTFQNFVTSLFFCYTDINPNLYKPKGLFSKQINTPNIAFSGFCPKHTMTQINESYSINRRGWYSHGKLSQSDMIGNPLFVRPTYLGLLKDKNIIPAQTKYPIPVQTKEKIRISTTVNRKLCLNNVFYLFYFQVYL